MSIEELSETACAEAISLVLNHVASVTKIPAAHLAIEIPGCCHTHPPTTDVVGGCAYCARRGNCFAGAADRTMADDRDRIDDVKKAADEIAVTLRALVERVFDILDTRGIATGMAREKMK